MALLLPTLSWLTGFHPAGFTVVLVLYEVFFSDRARAAPIAGGQVLLVPTNAASYTTEGVPATELAAARMRATMSCAYDPPCLAAGMISSK